MIPLECHCLETIANRLGALDSKPATLIVLLQELAAMLALGMDALPPGGS
jgi:hypothetical protein